MRVEMIRSRSPSQHQTNSHYLIMPDFEDLRTDDLLDVKKLIKFCLLHLQMLPTPYQAEDCSR